MASGTEPSNGTANGGEDLHELLLTTQQIRNDVYDDDVIEKDIVFPSWLFFRPNQDHVRVNHNVALNLLICVVYGVADSLWSGTVIAAYLKRLGHERNSPVGNVEAASGLATLFSALPVGYLADKIGRAKVIRAGGVLIIATVAMHVLLLEWIGVKETAMSTLSFQGQSQHPHAFWYMGAVLAFWGIAGGVVSGPAQALYADSTPAGSRSTYYTYLFAAYLLSSCVGPLVSIGLFQTLGDEWDLYHLRIVIYVGLALELVNAVLMMFFDDRKALDESDNREDENQQTPERSEGTVMDEEQQRQVAVMNETQEELSPAEENQGARMITLRKYIPYIVFTQSMIFAIGSGMTVKFFPLFFRDEVGMSPTHVQIIYFLVPIAMAAFSGVGQKLAKTGFGRVQSALVIKVAGVLCLYAMVLFKNFLDTHPWALVPVYVVRTSLMNCTYPLQESIVMDYVPKNERGRWKSLDSVAMFGWCGSAALGGWLTDKYDYTYTFFITALIQSVGILCFALLLPLVPRREEDLTTTSGPPTTRQSNTDASNGASTAPSVEATEQPKMNGHGEHKVSSRSETETSTLSDLEEPLLPN